MNNEQRDAAIADLTNRLEVLEEQLAAIRGAASVPEHVEPTEGE